MFIILVERRSLFSCMSCYVSWPMSRARLFDEESIMGKDEVFNSSLKRVVGQLCHDCDSIMFLAVESAVVLVVSIDESENAPLLRVEIYVYPTTCIRSMRRSWEFRLSRCWRFLYSYVGYESTVAV